MRNDGINMRKKIFLDLYLQYTLYLLIVEKSGLVCPVEQ